MSTHVPSSPSLSPGRNPLRSIPQSPSLGFRATHLAGAPLPLTSRHAKSTSDLGQARQSRYDPGRLALGPARPNAASSSTSGCSSHVKGASPTARLTLNSAVHVTSQQHNRGGSPMPNARLTSPRTDTPRWTSAHSSGTMSRHCTPHSSRQSTTCGQSSASGCRGGSTPPPPYRHTRSSVGRVATRSTAATGGASGAGQRGNSLDASASQSSPSSTASRGNVPVTEPVAAVQGPPPQGQGSPVNATGNVAKASAGRPWVMGGSSARSSPRTTQAHGSPRLHNSQWSHSIAHLGNSSKAVSVEADVKPEVAAEAMVTLAMGDGCDQMVQVRDSLLQHIHSVQKEITRLQAEKGRSQRNTKASINSPRLSVRTHTPGDKLNTGARACQSRCLPKDQQETAAVGSHGQANAEPGAPQSAGPATTAWAPRSAAAKIQRTWRHKRKNCSATSVATAEPPTNISEPSHRHSSSRQAHGGNDAPYRPKAMHHAAARIQRAWRLSRWRRLFVSFSVHKVGWVGSIEWLRNRNMLYGTELAEPEDVDWWVEQRALAPLDREVDPWGCTKLRDHLNKMWYGLTTEELQARLEQLEASQVGQARPAQPSLASQSQSNGGGNTSSSRRSPRRTDRASAVRTAASLSPRHEPRSARSEDLGHGSRINARNSAAVQSTLQSFPSPPQTHRSARGGAQAAALAQANQKTTASGSAVGRVSQDLTSRRWTGSRRSLPALTSSWNVPQSCSSTSSAVRAFRLQTTTVSR